MGRVRVEQVRRLDTGLKARDAAAYEINKAKCLLDALETPLSHCHTLCLIGLYHIVKLEPSRIF